MTIRLAMRRAVGKASEALGDSADAVRTFFAQHMDDDGGFCGRDGHSDLYYTVFGLEASMALKANVPYERVSNYLDGFETGSSLDLVHLASLARCRANLADRRGELIDPAVREAMTERLLAFRADDGGYNTTCGAERGHVYGSFPALGLGQDLQVDCLDAEALVQSVRSLQMPDGGFSNESTMNVSATAASAAAVTIFHYLKRPIPELTLQWLLARAAPCGGFVPIPLDLELAIPDLLSTATAIHALCLAKVPMEALKATHLDYLDALWSVRGGFQGHPGDEVLDCEYTYYGLLSLGDLIES